MDYPNLDFKVLDLSDTIQIKINDIEKVGENLTANQILIIEKIKQNNKISARELSNIIGISSRKIEENIRKLKGKHLLKWVGAAKGGYWKINNND